MRRRKFLVSLAAAAARSQTSIRTGGVVRRYPALTTPVDLNVTDFMMSRDPDATNALLRLQTQIRLNTSARYRVTFPSGLYRYTNNTFLNYVGDVAFIAPNGAQFQCIANMPSVGNMAPVAMADLFRGLPWNGRPYDAPVFASVSAGSYTLTLLARSQTSLFLPGMRVFIYGFDQQFGGYPYNGRYSEWNTVASIGPGVITLASPLMYSYDQTWLDGGSTNPVGAPRLLPLVRSGGYLYNKRLELNGIQILGNPYNAGNAENDSLEMYAEEVIYRNVTIPSGAELVPSMSRYALFEGCNVETIEIDKLGGTCEIKGGTIGQIIGGTGFDTVVIDGVTTGPRYAIAVSARNTTVKNCTIHSAKNSYSVFGGYGWPIVNLTFENNTIIQDGLLHSAVDTGRWVGFTVAGVSANDILLNNDSAHHNIIRQLAPGAIIWSADFTNRGRVTDITFNGTHFVLSGSWPHTPITGASWYFLVLQNVAATGTTWVGGSPPVLSSYRLPQIGGTTITVRPNVIPSPPRSFWSTGELLEVFGTLVSIELQVTMPYTSPDSPLTLGVAVGSPSYIAFVYSLNRVGSCEVQVGRISASPPAERIAPIPVNTLVNSMNAYGPGAAGAVAQTPSFTLKIMATDAFPAR